MTSLGVMTRYHAALKEKIATFDPVNPLGLSYCQEQLFRWSVPLLVTFSLLGAAFSWRVLSSRWIRNLVTTPIFVQLTWLCALLTVCGPGYVWLMQEGVWLITTRQVYLCFILNWAHNAALVATAWTVVLLVMERTFTVFSPESSWAMLQRRVRRLCSVVLLVSLIISVTGLVMGDVTTDEELIYPVCNPWWHNENTSNAYMWNWLLNLQFSVVPTLFVMVATVMLKFSVSRFKKMVRARVDDMDHYSGLLLELRTKSSYNFCVSCQWLAVLFTLCYFPLGMFVISGPSIQYSLSSPGHTPTTTLLVPDPPLYNTPRPNGTSGDEELAPGLSEKEFLKHIEQYDRNNTQDTSTTGTTRPLIFRKKRDRQQRQRDRPQRPQDDNIEPPLHLSSGLRNGNPSDYGPDGKKRVSRDAASDKLHDALVSSRQDNYLSHSYVIQLSRTCSEVTLWMICYLFSALVTPVLLATELLYRREAGARLNQMHRRLMCRAYTEKHDGPLDDTQPPVTGTDHTGTQPPDTGDVTGDVAQVTATPANTETTEEAVITTNGETEPLPRMAGREINRAATPGPGHVAVVGTSVSRTRIRNKEPDSPPPTPFLGLCACAKQNSPASSKHVLLDPGVNQPEKIVPLAHETVDGKCTYNVEKDEKSPSKMKITKPVDAINEDGREGKAREENAREENMREESVKAENDEKKKEMLTREMKEEIARLREEWLLEDREARKELEYRDAMKEWEDIPMNESDKKKKEMREATERLKKKWLEEDNGAKTQKVRIGNAERWRTQRSPNVAPAPPPRSEYPHLLPSTVVPPPRVEYPQPGANVPPPRADYPHLAPAPRLAPTPFAQAVNLENQSRQNQNSE